MKYSLRSYLDDIHPFDESYRCSSVQGVSLSFWFGRLTSFKESYCPVGLDDVHPFKESYRLFGLDDVHPFKESYRLFGFDDLFGLLRRR